MATRGKPPTAERRRTIRREIERTLAPCTRCGGTEFRYSREVYLDAFRLLVCATCGVTEWRADDLEALLAHPEFGRRVQARAGSPYR